MLKTKDSRIEQILNAESQEKIHSYQMNEHFISAFTREQDLALLIYNIINDGNIVTVEDIQQIAITTYYSPICISTKALIIFLAREKKSIYDKWGEIKIGILIYDEASISFSENSL